jgi:multidrug resistance efflux pump
MQQAEEATPGRARSRHIAPGRWQRILASWPLLSWLALVALCGILYLRTTQFGIVSGTAQSIHHDVAPLQVARVKELFVHVGDPVTNGQIVAQMDTTLIDAQLAEAEASLATVQNTMATYQGQMLGLVRAADEEILKSQHALELQKNQAESDGARLAQLKSIQAERDRMSKANLIPEQLADALRPEIASLEKVVAAYPALLAMDERVLEDHRKQRADLQKALHLGPDDDVMKALAEKAAAEARVLEAALAARRLEKETYSLRASAEGTVSDILVSQGVVAKAAESVVRIVSKSDLIMGYLPEFRLGSLRIGDPGYAFRMGRPTVKVEVVSVVPEINPVPTKLTPISAPLGVTFRSQKIVFQMKQPSDITAGEKVEIRMESEWSANLKRWLGKLSP